jgi:hypothetical protein
MMNTTKQLMLKTWIWANKGSNHGHHNQ